MNVVSLWGSGARYRDTPKEEETFTQPSYIVQDEGHKKEDPKQLETL